MVPVIEAFKTAHGLDDVTVVADAAMLPRATSRPSRTPDCRSSWAR